MVAENLNAADQRGLTTYPIHDPFASTDIRVRNSVEGVAFSQIAHIFRQWSVCTRTVIDVIVSEHLTLYDVMDSSRPRVHGLCKISYLKLQRLVEN